VIRVVPQAVYRIVDDLAALAREPCYEFGPATAALKKAAARLVPASA
jgi:1,2-diacylglycerol 3-beta-galactosyltransferase